MRKSIYSYNLFQKIIHQVYAERNKNIIKTKIGNKYNFDIKRKWGYQKNLYYMKTYWDEETHIKDNPKLHNMIMIE